MRTKIFSVCMVAAMLALGACQGKKPAVNTGPMTVDAFTAASQNVVKGKLLDVSVAGTKMAGRISVDQTLRGMVSEKSITLKEARIVAGDASSLTPGAVVYVGFDAKKSGVYENLKIMKALD